MSKISKLAVVVLAIAVVGSFVPVSKTQAQTVEELTAQISNLLALIAQLQAQIAGGASTPAGGASYTYTQDLTLGSTGADVSALQQFLVSKGFLTMPAGASYGYFGPLTKAALGSYQASVGISPSAGYFGPITRAHMNSMVSVVPSTAPGVSPAPTTPVLSGGEGILTVDTNATPAAGATYYEGDSNVGLLGLKIKAQNGDVAVQRVKVGIGTSVTFYTKAFTTLSLYDGDTLLQSVSLNSDNVVKEGSDYYVYFSGLNVFVGQDTTKVLTLKGSIMGVVGSYTSHTITIPVDGVRAIDAAGLTQQSPSGAITRSITISTSLTEQAQLIMSKSSNSPDSTNLVTDSQGNLTEATVAVFDFKTKNDMAKIDTLKVTLTGNATPTAAFLYDGSSLVNSTSVTNGSSTNTGIADTATFVDMEDVFQISKDSTKSITVKVTYAGGNSTVATSSASIAATTDVTAYNSEGIAIDGTGNTSISGTPSGNTMTVISAGPVFALQSATESYQGGTQGVASSSISGSIVVSVEAAGNDIFFSGTSTDTFAKIYDGSSYSTPATSTSISFSSAFTDQGNGNWKLAEGQSGTITISFLAKSSAVTGNFLNFRLSGLAWDTANQALTKSTSLDVNDYMTTPSYPLP